FFFFSSRRRHTRFSRDWSSDVCSSDLIGILHRNNRIIGLWGCFYDRICFLMNILHDYFLADTTKRRNQILHFTKLMRSKPLCTRIFSPVGIYPHTINTQPMFPRNSFWICVLATIGSLYTVHVSSPIFIT